MPDRKPTPPREREEPDAYDRDLVRDNDRTEGGQRGSLPSADGEPYDEGLVDRHLQKDRTGQAQSPAELNLDQPEKGKKGRR